MNKLATKFLLVFFSALITFSANATHPVSDDIVLSGTLGQCTKSDPCTYRVTKKDVTISGGYFKFSADSNGLCYDQYIVVKRNRSTAFATLMSGSDHKHGSFGVNPNDLLAVYVLELPAPHVCVWEGELNWQITR